MMCKRALGIGELKGRMREETRERVQERRIEEVHEENIEEVQEELSMCKCK